MKEKMLGIVRSHQPDAIAHQIDQMRAIELMTGIEIEIIDMTEKSTNHIIAAVISGGYPAVCVANLGTVSRNFNHELHFLAAMIKGGIEVFEINEEEMPPSLAEIDPQLTRRIAEQSWDEYFEITESDVPLLAQMPEGSVTIQSVIEHLNELENDLLGSDNSIQTDVISARLRMAVLMLRLVEGPTR